MATRHLLGLRQLDRAQIEALLDGAQVCADGRRPDRALRGRTVATLFYEPSTRTEMSFDLAARRLGAQAVRCDVERSSVKKGESLLDTVRTLEALGVDVIVLRHPAAGAAHLASRWVNCAVVNAGDGMHEHPTQGLVDLLTVRHALGRIAGLRVAIVGDIVHSRVARSAVWGFTKLGATVTLVGPATLLPLALHHPPFAIERLSSIHDSRFTIHGASHESRVTSHEITAVRMTTSLEEGLDGADVVMALRMQRERLQGSQVPAAGEYARIYGITAGRLQQLCPQAILMHPGPMNLGVEVRADAAYGPQSVINTQVANGVVVRMAVLLWALGLEHTMVDRRWPALSGVEGPIVDKAEAQTIRSTRSPRSRIRAASTRRQTYTVASLWAQDGETVDAVDARDATDAIDGVE